MAKKVADIGGKRLVSLAPSAWSQWVTGNDQVTALEIIGSDFQWIGRENDVLIKASSPSVGEFLIANELQLRYKKNMPSRMRAYAALAEEKYGLPVYPVLINILRPSSSAEVQQSFATELMGLKARQDFRVLNLWEVDVNLVFQDNLAPLLPFVPILKGGDSPELLQRALIQLERDEDLAELESLLAFFASFVLDTGVIQQILRWDMTVLRESPWYQEILLEGENRGMEKGRAEGRDEGLEQGRLEGELALLLRLIERRFGSIPLETAAKIRALPLEEIEQLGEALLDFSDQADLEKWLDQAE